MSSIHPNDPNTYNLAILIRTHISKKSRRSIHYPFLKIYLQIQLKNIRLGSMNIQAFNTTLLKPRNRSWIPKVHASSWRT